jgi:hypothetical protein
MFTTVPLYLSGKKSARTLVERWMKNKKRRRREKTRRRREQENISLGRHGDYSEGSWFRPREGPGIFIFSEASNHALKYTQPHVHWVLWAVPLL